MKDPLDKRSVARMLLLALLRVTPCASAQVPERGFLFEIDRLYEDMEYERALDQVRRARAAPHVTGTAMLLWLYEGIILSEMGQQAEAAAAFKSVLLLRPDTRLPVRVSPKIEAHFESVQQQVVAELASLGVQNHQSKPALAHAERKPDSAPIPPHSRPQGSEQAQPQSPKPQKALSSSPPPKPLPSAVQPTSLLATRQPPASVSHVRGQSTLVSVNTADLAHKSKQEWPLSVRIPAIAGTTLVAIGGSSCIFGLVESNRINLLTGRVDRESVVRGRSMQVAGVSLLGVGLTAVAVATGIYILGTPDQSVSVGVGSTGNSAFVYGKWP